MRPIDADALKPEYIVGSTSTGTKCYRYVSFEQIMNAPTVDVAEVPRWIPVTERLPEDDCAVLVYERGNRNIFLGIWTDERWVSFDPGDKLTWFDETDYCDIVAWMPLPKPFREGEE